VRLLRAGEVIPRSTENEMDTEQKIRIIGEPMLGGTTGASMKRSTHAGRARARYEAPDAISSIGLWKLLRGVRRLPLGQAERLTLPGLGVSDDGPTVFYAGAIDLVARRCVAIVGSRSVSPAGTARARKLARELSAAGVVVVSGLAAGVDTAAHEAAIEVGGRTIGVIGTPLDVAYPAKNAPLQERIYREHLLVTQFRSGSRVFPSNFPRRNKLMAAMTDATVIIEASDTSGTLHQAAECREDRLDRWLFIAKSVVDDPKLTWPKRFLGGAKVRVLEKADDILGVL
jgi:DNA processing protein